MQRSIFNLTHVFLELLVAVLLAVSSTAAAGAQNAIDFTLRDIDGTPHKLSDYLGERVVLINFWATWCQPCTRELQHLQKFHEEYSDEGLLMLAISVDGPGTQSQIIPFLNRHGYTFPVLLDTESKVLALYDPQVILPYTILIDRDGIISYVQKGYSPGDEYVLQDSIIVALGASEVPEPVAYTIM